MNNFSPNYRATTLFLDGAHTLRRSMYIDSIRELSTSKGVPSGGVFGFMKSLLAACNTLSASSIVVCLEGGHSPRRKALFEGYKVREPVEVEERDMHGMTDYEYYRHQLSWIESLLSSLGVPQIRVIGKEGDDVLYRAVHMVSGNKIIVSEDKDFYSLVSPEVSVYRPISKEYIEMSNIQQYGDCRSPLQFLYMKALLGDGSDCIPQVAKGVGGGTVKKLLDLIPDEELSAERIIQESAKSSSARTKKIAEAGIEVLRRNIDLVDISREPFDFNEITRVSDALSRPRTVDLEKAGKIMRALEFSDDTISSIVGKVVPMMSFPLNELVDSTYVKRVIEGVV